MAPDGNSPPEGVQEEETVPVQATTAIVTQTTSVLPIKSNTTPKKQPENVSAENQEGVVTHTGTIPKPRSPEGWVLGGGVAEGHVLLSPSSENPVRVVPLEIPSLTTTASPITMNPPIVGPPKKKRSPIAERILRPTENVGETQGANAPQGVLPDTVFTDPALEPTASSGPRLRFREENEEGGQTRLGNRPVGGNEVAVVRPTMRDGRTVATRVSDPTDEERQGSLDAPMTYRQVEAVIQNHLGVVSDLAAQLEHLRTTGPSPPQTSTPTRSMQRRSEENPRRGSGGPRGTGRRYYGELPTRTQTSEEVERARLIHEREADHRQQGYDRDVNRDPTPPPSPDVTGNDRAEAIYETGEDRPRRRGSGREGDATFTVQSPNRRRQTRNVRSERTRRTEPRVPF